MSHNFKRPKKFVFMGTENARLAKAAALILNQEHLDKIMSKMRPEMRMAGLERIRPYLRFTPLEYQVEKTEETVGNPSGN